ncbi:MAG TPA: glutamate--cysteine ligase [Pseudonocardiaceae bacterium]|nr:glutamate--cysteine ligase [Pseudonocardiaceae bacterium]
MEPSRTTHELTLGVEEEFLVVDETGNLSYRGTELAADVEDIDGEFQRELVRCQVETTTPVCRDAGDVLRHLTELRRDVAGRAAERGLRLVPSGTPVLPATELPEISPGSRYQRMAEWFGDIARTSNTCGCHVHVAMADRTTGVRVINRVRAWLPVLLALSANSPFDSGSDTSYHSWRHILWSRWPSSGPPPVFDSLDHYETSVDAMLRSGALQDRGMVYWDIRLSEHQPTIEFRVCDVTRTAEVAALLAGLIKGLVATALDGSEPVTVPHEVLRANLWRTAREGPGGRCLHPVSGDLVPVWDQVDDLVQLIGPALRGDSDLDLIKAGLAALRESGGGAERQRAGYAERGRWTDVVAALAIT